MTTQPVTGEVRATGRTQDLFPGNGSSIQVSDSESVTSVTDPICCSCQQPEPLPEPVACLKCGETIAGAVVQSKPHTQVGPRPFHVECLNDWDARWLRDYPERWTTRECAICGRTFHRLGNYWNRRYCSDECAYTEALRRSRRGRGNHHHECNRCGVEFHGRADARYCSTRCRVAAHRAQAVTS